MCFSSSPHATAPCVLRTSPFAATELSHDTVRPSIAHPALPRHSRYCSNFPPLQRKECFLSAEQAYSSSSPMQESPAAARESSQLACSWNFEQARGPAQATGTKTPALHE